MNATFSTGFVCDAVSIFGFGLGSDEPLPEPTVGEIVIRFGGWSLQDLRDSKIRDEFMHQQDWYEQHAWSREQLPPGNYRLRVPVPDSNRKTFEQQQAMLPPEEQVAPAVLVATAMLVHRLPTGEDLLKTDFTRCREQRSDGNRIGLFWREDRIEVTGYWDACYTGRVWLSSLRTS